MEKHVLTSAQEVGKFEPPCIHSEHNAPPIQLLTRETFQLSSAIATIFSDGNWSWLKTVHPMPSNVYTSGQPQDTSK